MRYGCFRRGAYLGEVIAESREDALAVGRAMFGEVTSVASAYTRPPEPVALAIATIAEMQRVERLRGANGYAVNWQHDRRRGREAQPA